MQRIDGKMGLPAWAVAALLAALGLAYAPGIVQVYGIQNNYEALIAKGTGFFHSDAARLFEFGRPVAALLSNITVLPLQELSDLRWTRLFALATVVGLAAQLMWLCVRHLRVERFTALVAALCTFLVPSFTYSILEPAAWTPHLLSIFLAFAAYGVLSRTNLQSVALLTVLSGESRRDFGIQARHYFLSPRVLWACAILQLAFYDYPPSALVMVLLPVISVLFSTSPPAFRRLVAARDLAFVSLNVALFFVSVKLLYLPIAHLFVPDSAAVDAYGDVTDFASKIGTTYAFQVHTNLAAAAHRLLHLLQVSGDMWFLPQLYVHVGVLIVVAVAIVISNAGQRASRECSGGRQAVEARLAWPDLLVVVLSFLLAVSPTLASVGGIVSYRTAAIPTAVVALVFVSATAIIVRRVVRPKRAAPYVAALWLSIAIAGTAATVYANWLVMELARKEFAYYSGLVRKAVQDKSHAIVVIDRRPTFLSEDLPVAADEAGYWLPPFELACFSGYCLPSQAAIRTALKQAGLPEKDYLLWTPRLERPDPHISCEALTSATPPSLAGASRVTVRQIEFFREQAALTCVNYDLAWRKVR